MSATENETNSIERVVHENLSVYDGIIGKGVAS